jgi:hypothetical protein
MAGMAEGSSGSREIGSTEYLPQGRAQSSSYSFIAMLFLTFSKLVSGLQCSDDTQNLVEERKRKRARSRIRNTCADCTLLSWLHRGWATREMCVVASVSAITDISIHTVRAFLVCHDANRTPQSILLKFMVLYLASTALNAAFIGCFVAAAQAASQHCIVPAQRHLAHGARPI